jgi:hypothetical protein
VDEGLQWVMAVEDADATFENLAVSGSGFSRLDAKL